MYKYINIFLLIVFVTSISWAQDEPVSSPEPKKITAEGSPFSQVKFNPGISLILDTSSVYRNLNDEAFEKLRIKGFQHTVENESQNQVLTNGNIGFNLNYAELALMAAVDPYFELVGIFHTSPSEFEIEEAYFITTSLPGGFGLKSGKFLSGFGKLNSQHSHQWDFTDQPMPYHAFFGDEGLNEVGAQLSWIAPADFFLNFGAEALQGVNETSLGTQGRHDQDFTRLFGGSKGPNAYVAFIKSSFDIDRLTVVFGVSGVAGVARYYNDFSDIDPDRIAAEYYGSLGQGIRAKTWIADAELTMKYFIDSFRYISFQGEYLYRIQSGNYYYTTPLSDGTPIRVSTMETNYHERRWGMYSQLLVKPFLRWRFGARYEMLGTHRVSIPGIKKEGGPSILPRFSVMMDFHPSEFSLFRLQYNYDRSLFNRLNHMKLNHEFILQANLAIGAHGAHPF